MSLAEDEGDSATEAPTGRHPFPQASLPHPPPMHNPPLICPSPSQGQWEGTSRAEDEGDDLLRPEALDQQHIEDLVASQHGLMPTFFPITSSSHKRPTSCLPLLPVHRAKAEGTSRAEDEGDDLLRPEALDQQRIEDLVAANLTSSLRVLHEEELAMALHNFVEKDDKVWG